MALAVAGTATAANKIGQNQLKRNAVGSKQLQRNAVKPAHIKNRAVKPRHLAPKLRNRIATGLPGPKGDKGEMGIPGQRGPEGKPGRVPATSFDLTFAQRNHAYEIPVGLDALMFECGAERTASRNTANVHAGQNRTFRGSVAIVENDEETQVRLVNSDDDSAHDLFGVITALPDSVASAHFTGVLTTTVDRTLDLDLWYTRDTREGKPDCSLYGTVIELNAPIVTSIN